MFFHIVEFNTNGKGRHYIRECFIDAATVQAARVEYLFQERHDIAEVLAECWVRGPLEIARREFSNTMMEDEEATSAKGMLKAEGWERMYLPTMEQLEALPGRHDRFVKALEELDAAEARQRMFDLLP